MHGRFAPEKRGTTRLRRPRSASLVCVPLIAHGKPAPQSHHTPTLPRPPHPVPNVRDDRDTPLCGTGRDCYRFDSRAGTEIFLQTHIDEALVWSRRRQPLILVAHGAARASRGGSRWFS